MRGHFLYLRFKTFSMTPRTPQWEVFWALLSNSKHSGVLEDSKSSLFPSVGLHPHTWPKWGCDNHYRKTIRIQQFWQYLFQCWWSHAASSIGKLRSKQAWRLSWKTFWTNRQEASPISRNPRRSLLLECNFTWVGCTLPIALRVVVAGVS